MSPDQAIDLAGKAASHAVDKNVVWFLVVSLILALVAGVFIAKWMIAQLEKVQLRADATNVAFTQHLTTANEKLVNVVASNQVTMERTSSVLERNVAALGRIEEKLKISGSAHIAFIIAIATFALLAVFLFPGCSALEMRASANEQGAEVTARLDYEKALQELGKIVAQWRGEQGLPDFTLPHADAPDFKEVR